MVEIRDGASQACIERQGEHVVLYLALLKDLGMLNILPDFKVFDKDEHIEVGLAMMWAILEPADCWLRLLGFWGGS